jgi:NAD-dependent SIR2 family protein deacetylase
MQSDSCKHIAVLSGAGVSVAAGIPDFRSPGGMYDTLKPELLTATDAQRTQMVRDPTAVVSRELFTSNPFPYLELRRPFILGTAEHQWKATASHCFFRCVADRGKLKRIYTQNIDGLDHQLGLPPATVINVHGSIATASCEFCGEKYPHPEFCTAVGSHIRDIYAEHEQGLERGTSKPILCKNSSCRKPGVKPDTVLYGSSLPARFFEAAQEDLPLIDVLFIAGTSLQVSPANAIPFHVREDCVRVVVNDTPVGHDMGGADCIQFGDGATRDVLLRGDADEQFIMLASRLGWVDELIGHAAAGRLSEASTRRLAAAR